LTALAPKRFKGSAEKFDNDFFKEIMATLPETDAFFQNAVEFQTSLKDQKGKLQERIKNPTSTPAPRPPVKDAATKQFEELMKKVDDLAGASKIGQAIAVLSKATVNTRFAAQKEMRLKELKAKHGGFNTLFNESTEPTGMTDDPGSDTLPDPSEDDPSAEEDPNPEEDPGEDDYHQEAVLEEQEEE
jgi:hypothetical protein